MLSLLVPGGTGQLGRDLAASADADLQVLCPGSREFDITDETSVMSAVPEFVGTAHRSGRSPVIINAAAYTAVDAAETDDERAFAVNARGPQTLAEACSSHDVPLIHVSTDYVFAGSSNRPYEPDDDREPPSVYGRTKAVGEDAVLARSGRSWIVRTAWLYGAAGENFVKTMIRLQGVRDTLHVVDDQRGSPTWTADFAAALLELSHEVVYGGGPRDRVLHCTNSGSTTRYGLARAVFEELGADPDRVLPCTSDQFPRPAPRPSYSVLSNRSWQRFGLAPLRHWRRALREFISSSNM